MPNILTFGSHFAATDFSFSSVINSFFNSKQQNGCITSHHNTDNVLHTLRQNQVDLIVRLMASLVGGAAW